MKQFTEKELSVLTDDLHQHVIRLHTGLQKAGSVAATLLITNILLIASLSMLLLIKVTQGSFSQYIIFIATLVFILFNGLSMVLLLSAIAKVHKGPYAEMPNIEVLAETDSQNILKTYYTQRITQLNQVKELIHPQWQKTMNLTRTGMILTGAAVTAYALVLSFAYF